MVLMKQEQNHKEGNATVITKKIAFSIHGGDMLSTDRSGVSATDSKKNMSGI